MTRRPSRLANTGPGHSGLIPGSSSPLSDSKTKVGGRNWSFLLPRNSLKNSSWLEAALAAFSRSSNLIRGGPHTESAAAADDETSAKIQKTGRILRQRIQTQE